jgi:hypothetical protein
MLVILIIAVTVLAIFAFAFTAAGTIFAAAFAA